MNKKRIRTIGEVILVAVMIGVIFFMGKVRVHQLHLGRFFPIGFAVTLVLMIAYSILFKATAEEGDESEDDKE